LKHHLESFEQLHNKQSKIVVADADYGSEENYEFLEKNEIEAFVKYNYFHMEQKRKIKNNIFLPQNLYYNSEQDYFVCPMGQHLTKKGVGTRISDNGYKSNVSYYQAANCSGYPFRGQCHKAKGNRTLEINFRLKELKEKAKELSMSEQGLYHRSRRPIEPEAVFGQLKSNNKFNRFTLRGLSKVNIEFGLMAIGHNLRKLAAKAAFSSHLVSLLQIIIGSNHYLKSLPTYIKQNRLLFFKETQNETKLCFAA